MKTFKKILLAALTALPVICTAVAVFFILPDQVGVHFGIDWQPDRWGSKYEAFIFPGAILLVVGIYLIIRSVMRKKKTGENEARSNRNLDILDTIVILTLVLFNALNVTVILLMNNAKSLWNPESLSTIILSTIIGVVFILIGNLMPKTKPNSFMGMRMKFTMDTDEHWYIANRAGGIAMVVSGLITVAAGLIFRNITYIYFMVGSLLITLTLAILYSYVKIKGEKKQ